MSYGPFSLTDATAAELTFQVWVNAENGYDGLLVGASVDGIHFYRGYENSGEWGEWEEGWLDLSDMGALGNLLGQPRVWIAFEFVSDDGTNAPEGVYVDDIVLRKCNSGDCFSFGRALHRYGERSTMNVGMAGLKR